MMFASLSLCLWIVIAILISVREVPFLFMGGEVGRRIRLIPALSVFG